MQSSPSPWFRKFHHARPVFFHRLVHSNFCKLFCNLTWFNINDRYGVLKLKEYCLDAIACNFETFAESREFRALLRTLPPPSGDSSLRTTRPSAPGTEVNADMANILDDLREKWLEAEAAELDQRDESATQFDRWLAELVLVAEQEALESPPDVDF